MQVNIENQNNIIFWYLGMCERKKIWHWFITKYIWIHHIIYNMIVILDGTSLDTNELWNSEDIRYFNGSRKSTLYVEQYTVVSLLSGAKDNFCNRTFKTFKGVILNTSKCFIGLFLFIKNYFSENWLISNWNFNEDWVEKKKK